MNRSLLKMNKKNIIILIILVLCLGFFLRIAGIFYQTYGDEHNYVYKSLQIGHFQFLDTYNMGVGLYILFFVDSAYFLIGSLVGYFHSVAEFINLYFSNPYSFFVLGRLVETIFGCLCIWGLYLLGREMFSPRVGIVAALFLAINPMHIELSQIARGQAVANLFLILSFLFLWRISKCPGFKNYVLFAVFAGCANSIRNYNIVIFLPFIIAHIKQCRNFNKGVLTKELIASLIIFLLVYALFVPELIFKVQIFILYISSLAQLVMGGQTAVAYIGNESAKPWLFYLKDGFPRVLTIPLYLVVMAALVFCIFKIRKVFAASLLLLFIGAYFLVICVSNIVSARYLLPVIPFLLLCSAYFLQEIINFIKMSPRAKSFIILTAAILVSISPVVQSVAHDLRILKPSTLVVGREWILENIPHGSRVAADGMGYLTPDLKLNNVIYYDLYNLDEESLRKEIAQREKKRIDSYALKYFLDNQPFPKYYILNLGTRVEVSLNEIKERGIQYVVINENLKKIFCEQSIINKHPKICHSRDDFYLWLEKDAFPIKSFSPHSHQRGPEITVYKVKE